jgi:KUP system potassium uptake protein
MAGTAQRQADCAAITDAGELQYYRAEPNIPGALRLLDPQQTEGQIAIDEASYFLSKLELRAGSEPTMAAWRKRLFVATAYIAADAAEYFGLPTNRTVVMGARIEV